MLLSVFHIRKRRHLQRTQSVIVNNLHGRECVEIKSRSEFTYTVLAMFLHWRERTLWMQPRSQVWFDMVNEVYNDELWYDNFRVTKGTLVYLLSKIEGDISHQNTRLREAVLAKRRLAITLCYLASTAEYRTICNLFGVSSSFVCQCLQEVCTL